MAFNTGNPIGSTDPRDFSDNSENLDRAVNNTASATWTDRLGNTRTSLAGQIGYIGTGAGGAIEDYAAGQELTTFSTIIRYSGEFYRPAAGATLPYTTTATTPDVDSNLVAVGDAVLRQDLADNSSLAGSDLLAHTGTSDTVTDALDKRTIYVGSVAESFNGLSGSDGQSYSVTGWHVESELGGGDFVFRASEPKSSHNGGTVISPTVPALSSQLSISDFLDGVGETDAAGSGCFIRLGDEIRVVDFGAYDDQTNDSTAQTLKALSARGLTGGIELPSQLRWTSVIQLPSNSKELRFFSREYCEVLCDHNGDGIYYLGDNENFGGHIFENIRLDGPNVRFPGVGYVPPSTGAGLRLETAYDCTLINFKSRSFDRGIKLVKGFNNKCVGDCEFVYNQVGVEITAPATNLNKFDGAKIRQNRVGGVLIDGSAGPPYPTQNSFKGAYIETNIPYNDGYPVGGPGDGSTSFGIKLIRTYSNELNAYFENQEYDIIFDSQSSYNDCSKTRHAPSGDFSRLGKVAFKGAGVIGNKFRNSEQIARNTTDVHVETDNSDHRFNEFLDCTGFNFIPAALVGVPFVRNNGRYGNNNGTIDGTISFPSYGSQDNPSEGTTRGTITGIGTATATLNANGLSEVRLGTTITSATTITSISGLKDHQLFTLWNYQEGQPVTIESTSKTGDLYLKDGRDALFNEFGQSITFWVNSFGRAYEIGRNFGNQNKGTVTISDASTSAIASFPVPFGDFSYKAFITQVGSSGSPPIEATRARVSGRGTGSITIALEAPPGAGNSVSVDWMVEST